MKFIQNCKKERNSVLFYVLNKKTEVTSDKMTAVLSGESLSIASVRSDMISQSCDEVKKVLQGRFS